MEVKPLSVRCMSSTSNEGGGLSVSSKKVCVSACCARYIFDSNEMGLGVDIGLGGGGGGGCRGVGIGRGGGAGIDTAFGCGGGGGDDCRGAAAEAEDFTFEEYDFLVLGDRVMPSNRSINS